MAASTPSGASARTRSRRPVAVGHRLGAEGAEVVVVALAGGRDDPGAAAPGQLDDEPADPAGRPVDEDGRALRDPGGLDRVGRGAAGHRHAGGQLPGQAVRLGQEPRRGDDRLVGVAVARHLRGDDLVARVPGGDAVADRLHHAGQLEPEAAERLRVSAQRARVELPVDRVDPDGADRDADLTGTGFRGGDLGEGQLLRAAEVDGRDDASHASVQRCAGAGDSRRPTEQRSGQGGPRPPRAAQSFSAALQYVKSWAPGRVDGTRR